MPLKREIKYICTSCKREVGKENLRSKRVQFREMSSSGPIVRSRVVAWLCMVPAADGSESCLERDPDWKRPLYSTAPGLADTSLAVS